MENKINIAELLKDCPRGMELDCTICNNVVTLYSVDKEGYYPINVVSKDGFHYELTCKGYVYDEGDAKCVIFPKGKTTWEGFQRPFKDGDILATDLGSVFFLNMRLNTDEYYGCYVGIGGDSSFHICVPFAYKECCGLATEEEKQKLFEAIKDNGYYWNPETKTLEKLPMFKVGDRIRHKEKTRWACTIARVKDRYYVDGHPMCFTLPFSKQDDYELVPNKFDITTLVPFESKVLVRSEKNWFWIPAIFGFYNKAHFFVLGGTAWSHCIPYNDDTKHLLGTTDDCEEYFKTWE